MPLQLLAGGLIQEMRHHPYTSLVALCALLLASWGMSVGWPMYSQMGVLNARVQQLEKGQALQTAEVLENRLMTVRADLFDLQARIQEIRDANGTPDRIYLNELKRLKGEEARAERSLTQYLAAHRELAEL